MNTEEETSKKESLKETNLWENFPKEINCEITGEYPGTINKYLGRRRRRW